jgi:hypothetical protein
VALGNYAGRCQVNLRNPTAQAECDRCGFWYPLDRLQKQFQWQGSVLAWTGSLVCSDRCLDIPFEQNKVLILPPDPKPRINPRPSANVTQAALLGFTPPTSFDYLGMTRFSLTLGDPIAGTYPTTKAGALAAVAFLSGIPTPAGINDQSITIAVNTAQTLLLPNTTRDWMVIYNPTQQVAEFALGSTAWNGTMNLAIGPGDAYFWAAAQNLQPVYQGVVTAIGQYPGLALWAFDAPAGSFSFGSDGGVLYIAGMPFGWQIGSAGLPPGSLYLVPDIFPGMFFAIGVVPGISPSPAAPPVFLIGLNEAIFLLEGGGNLPLSIDGSGLAFDQLFNNGGLVCVASGAVQPFLFAEDGGVIWVAGQPPGWHIGGTGLSPGSVYLLPNSDGSTAAFAIGIVPGYTPNPEAAPMFFGGVSPTTLLGIGGGNLPLSSDGSELLPGQLFNNGGLLCAA